MCRRALVKLSGTQDRKPHKLFLNFSTFKMNQLELAVLFYFKARALAYLGFYIKNFTQYAAYRPAVGYYCYRIVRLGCQLLKCPHYPFLEFVIVFAAFHAVHMILQFLDVLGVFFGRMRFFHARQMSIAISFFYFLYNFHGTF